MVASVGNLPIRTSFRFRADPIMGVTRTSSMSPVNEDEETEQVHSSPSGASGQRKDKAVALKEMVDRLNLESANLPNQSDVHAPWINEYGEKTWSDIHIKLYRVTTSQKFDSCMGVIIVLNMILMIWETDYRAQCHPEYSETLTECPYDADKLTWLYTINLMLLLVYTFEAMLHIVLQGPAYFFNRWNLLDFFIVLAGWVAQLFEGFINMSYLRIFRITRLMRAFRVVLSIRELYMLLTGLASSFKAIFFGALLLGLMLTCWSIVLVEFVHPVNALLPYDNCPRCNRGFSSVTDSTLTLFQTIIAGDSWGLISVPVIEESPALAVILVAIVLSVSLGVMNLILAVIVESAAEARAKDRDEMLKQKAKEQLSTKAQLLKICSEIDTDFSGSISFDEMQQAYRSHREFRKIMTLLEVTEQSLTSVFGLMDSDKSGSVDYGEFCDLLYSLTTSDVRSMVAIQKFTQADFENEMRKTVTGLLAQSEAARITLESHSEILRSIESRLPFSQAVPWKDPSNLPFATIEVENALHDLEAFGFEKGTKASPSLVGNCSRDPKPRPSPLQFSGETASGSVGKSPSAGAGALAEDCLATLSPTAASAARAAARAAGKTVTAAATAAVQGASRGKAKAAKTKAPSAVSGNCGQLESTLLTDLDSLKSRLEDLAGQSAELAGRAHQRTASLWSQAHRLAAFHMDFLRSEADQWESNTKEDILRELRRTISSKIHRIVEDLEGKLRDEVDIVSASSSYIHEICGSLPYQGLPRAEGSLRFQNRVLQSVDEPYEKTQRRDQPGTPS